MNAVRGPLGWTRTVLREGRRQRVSRIVAGDATAARALRGLMRGTGPSGRVAISIRALGGQCVELRPRSTDAEVAVATFAGRYHRPPPELQPIERIWDIGANVGLTTADFAERHPGAHIVALEPHPANFELAALNVAPYASRCTLLQSAAWIRDGRVGLDGEAGPEDGYHVTEAAPARSVDALSLNTLLVRYGPPDYVKLDIEGAEQELLNEATDWSTRVRCISVECHPPYGVAACQADLERLGFDTVAYPQTILRRARGCVVGLRRREGAT